MSEDDFDEESKRDYDYHYCESHDSYYCEYVDKCDPQRKCFPAKNQCKAFRNLEVR